MIDISCMTEEEQETILAVLRRDAKLNEIEEQRIKKLKKTERDKRKLKYLTGEWFYETKSSRYRDKIHGTDIIRSSLTQRKPVTILELTQIWPEKPSISKSEKKDVFVPAELSGLIPDLSSTSTDNRIDHCQAVDNKVSYPQIKPRKNPFNTKPSGPAEKLDEQLQTNGVPSTEQQQAGDSNRVSKEAPLGPVKACQTPQIPAEDHHEDYPEPCSLWVTEPHNISLVQGKKECHYQVPTEEEESPINKVLGWFGKRDRYGKKERHGVLEEQSKEESHESPDMENAPEAEIKEKPSKSKPRPGLLTLVSKMKTTEIPENKPTKDDVACPPDDLQDHVIVESQVPETPPNPELDKPNDVHNSSLNPNLATEEHEQLPVLFITEDDDTINSIAGEEHLDREDTSQNHMTGDQDQIKLSLLEADSTDDATEASCTTNQKPREHEKPQNTLNNEGQMPDEIPPTSIPLIRKALNQKNTEPPTRETNGAKIMISSHSCIPDVNVLASPRHHQAPNKPPQNGSPTNIDPGRFSSLKNDIAMITSSSKEYVEKSPTRVPSACSTHKSDANECRKLLPRLPALQKNILGITDDNLAVTEHARTPTPMHISKCSKVPPKEMHPIKEPRKVLSLRAFPIDIGPTQNIQVNRLVRLSTCRDLTSSALGSSREELYDCNDQAERLEQHMFLPHYKVTAQESSLNLGKSQSPRQISTGHINRKEQIPISFPPISQGQTLIKLLASSQDHRNIFLDAMKVEKELGSTQPNIYVIESYISQSSQYNSSSDKFTSTSEGLDQPEGQEGVGVHVGNSPGNGSQAGISNDYSHSGQPHPEWATITHESCSSTLAEASSPTPTDGTDNSSMLRATPKQLTVRPLSISKSLEDISTQPSNERWNNDPVIEITLSEEDAPNSLMPVLDPEKAKRLSCSVPDFLQQQDDGGESESLSLNIFHSDRRRKSSTNTNISVSSGLASMSSGSVTNIYSSEFGPVGVRGTIQFAINYVPKLGELQIFIVQCRDLAAAEPKRNRSDPYVKCYLLPDKTKMSKRKTSVKKKTLNPIYNEILRYKIPIENLKVLTLNVSVWHNDTFGRNTFLGEVDVGLSDWDFNNTHMMDCELKERFSTPSSPTRGNHNMEVSGEMCVALRLFLKTSQSDKTHQTGELQIWVKKCRSLPSSGGTLDPFVKCSLLPDTNQKRQQKTRVVKKTTNPEFNHTVVFDGLRAEHLTEICVELTVWDHDRLSNHFIGGTRLGLGTGKSHGTKVNWMDSNSCEVELWKRMIESKNEWVEDSVPLRMLIMAKSVSR